MPGTPSEVTTRETPLILKTQLTNLSSSRGERAPRSLNSKTYLPKSSPIRTCPWTFSRPVRPSRTWSPHTAYGTAGSLEIQSEVRDADQATRLGGVRGEPGGPGRISPGRTVRVDLNHSEYFYDSRRQELEAAGLPVSPNSEEGSIHSTNDPTNHPVTIHHVLLAIKKTLLDPAGVDLMVASDTSALHPDPGPSALRGK